ncbi:conserved hypothetical protein, partial [Ricinus communis]
AAALAVRTIRTQSGACRFHPGPTNAQSALPVVPDGASRALRAEIARPYPKVQPCGDPARTDELAVPLRVP